jgi:hypothetical protein
MNTNRTAPLNAARASAIVIFAILVFIVVAIFYLVISLFSGDKKKTKPNAPANTEAESPRKEAESTRENPEFRIFSPEIPVKSVPVPSAPREIISQPAVPTAHKIISQAFASAVTTHPKSLVQPALIKKPGITREDMAKTFQPGALTRQAAVAKLKQLGFGQTAAYAALLPDGRFSAWLQFAPDGTITWNG